MVRETHLAELGVQGLGSIFYVEDQKIHLVDLMGSRGGVGSFCLEGQGD